MKSTFKAILAGGTLALLAIGVGAGTAQANTVKANSSTPAAVGVLRGGVTLQAGHYLRSPNGRYAFLQQSDGNAVVYRTSDKVALWATETNGHRGAYTEFQSNGDLVVYDRAHKPLWTSRTGGHAGSHLLMQDDGNMVVYSAGKKALWAWKTNSTEMLPGETLTAGHTRLSENRKFRLAMGTDGNLVLRQGNTALWNSHTQGHAGAYLSFQSNGNLVVHSVLGTVLWQSGTHGKMTRLLVQSDGNLVLYSGTKAVWSTNTH